MSATKWLAKQLKTWTATQRSAYRLDLEGCLRTEKNPMVRASLQSQVRMIEAADKK